MKLVYLVIRIKHGELVESTISSQTKRYIGDSLWQKTYTTEAIPTVRHRNTGACEQYYVEGTHPPIISKEVFTKVQILIQMRKENYGEVSIGDDSSSLKKGYLWVLWDSTAKETAKR